MFCNYFKTAIRNLRRNKNYALINVPGLTVGIAASLVIFLVIQFETSFDNFHKKKDSIYRIATEFHRMKRLQYNQHRPGCRRNFPWVSLMHIAIFISCIGLYELVSFMAVQRTKEMGFRKVLGATAQNNGCRIILTVFS